MTEDNKKGEAALAGSSQWVEILVGVVQQPPTGDLYEALLKAYTAGKTVWTRVLHVFELMRKQEK